MKLKTSLLMIVFVLSALLTGCGTEFDASGYVRACLDANTHGEFDEYARLTNMTAEEIKKKNYDDRLDQEIAYLDTYKADDETKQKFRSLFEKMYNSFKYEVGDAVKNDDESFSVPVTTYKLKAFGDIMTDITTFATDFYTEKAESGDTNVTEDEINKVVVDYMYDYISKNLEKLEYEEGVPINVTVSPTPGNKNVYTISTKNLQELLKSMVDIDKMS